VTILHGISREHYAMHATQFFIDRSGVPHAHVECAPGMGTFHRESTLFKTIVKFFLKGVVFMFWHDIIVYIELLYCVTNFELVWTWNKVAVVENAKNVDCTPPSPTHTNWLLPCDARCTWTQFCCKMWGDRLVWNQYITKPKEKMRGTRHIIFHCLKKWGTRPPCPPPNCAHVGV